MQADNNNDISATILIEIPDTVMHRLVNKQKSLFTSGVFKVAKIDNPNQHTVYFLNLNSFYYTLNKTVHLLKIVYDDTISYLFLHFDNGLSALTILKSSPHVHNFQEIISNAAVLVEYGEGIKREDIAQKIEHHCPGIDKEPIFTADKIKKAIKDTGKFLGQAFKTIGGYVSTGVEYVGQYLDSKTTQSAQKADVDPQTKQKWDTLKSGTSNAVSVSMGIFNTYLMPVITKGVEYTKQLGKKAEQSDNANYKYVKELADSSGLAIAEAITGLASGTVQVGSTLNKETKKIVNKKYGEDYVKTFLPDDAEKKQQKLQYNQTEMNKTEVVERQAEVVERQTEVVERQTAEGKTEVDATDKQQTSLYPDINEKNI